MFLIRQVFIWLIAKIYLFKLNSLFDTYSNLFMENKAYIKVAKSLFNKYSLLTLNGNESRGIYINSRFSNLSELVKYLLVANEKIEAYMVANDKALLASMPNVKSKETHWIYSWVDNSQSIDEFLTQYIRLHQYFIELKYSDQRFLYLPAASKIEAILTEAHEFIIDTIQIQHI